MSAKADKGNRKREIEQSPMKKKIRDSTISREDLDDAIANSIKLALKGTPLFLEIGSFYTSPRVKKLSFTVFESIQPISGSGGSTFSLA